MFINKYDYETMKDKLQIKQNTLDMMKKQLRRTEDSMRYWRNRYNECEKKYFSLLDVVDKKEDE